MSSAPTIALVGFDPGIAVSLPEPLRRKIEWLSEGYLLSVFMLAAPICYTVWLIEHSLLAMLLCSSFALVLMLTVLRLLNSGGGIAPHMTDGDVRAYSPTLVPLLVWFVLALLFAQIAQLPVFQRELDASVRAHRTELMKEHDAARRQVGAEIHPEYGADIERCEFLMFRMQQLWSRPGRTLALTAAYVAMVTAPFVFGFLFAGEALRAYSTRKVVAMRQTVLREAQDAEAERRRLLRQFTDEAAPPLYADAPFNRRVRAPLLMSIRRARPTGAGR